jgi:hypothetical protein
MNTLVYNLSKFEHECSPAGAECVFITHAMRVGEYWFGIKVYPRARDRDAAYRMQKKFAGEGLAPPCGSHVLVMRHRGRGKKPVREHGYLTGMCERIRDGHDITWELRHLERKLEQAGLEIHDLSSSNVGYWKGSLVCIDFGEISEKGSGYTQ